MPLLYVFVFLNNFVIVRTLLPQYVKVAHFSVGVSRVIGACLCLGYMATCLYLLFPKMVLMICLSLSLLSCVMGYLFLYISYVPRRNECQLEKYFFQHKRARHMLRMRRWARSVSILTTDRCLKNFRDLVRQRTIPTELPPLVGEVSANF
jgi:hypothetical protein